MPENLLPREGLQMFEELKNKIEKIYNNKEQLKTTPAKDAVLEALALLNDGKIRVAEKQTSGWEVNVWVKQAILLYFQIAEMREIQSGDLEYYDKIPVRTDHNIRGVRVVPPAV